MKKECTSCGAPNDTLLTNCIFCKAALPQTDVDSIQNEDLIMQCGEWVGRLSAIRLYPGPKFGIKMQAPAGFVPSKNIENLFGLSGDSNQVFVDRAEIVGNVQKYLNVLQIRAVSNPNLPSIVRRFQDTYDNYQRAKSKGLFPKLFSSLFGSRSG